MRSPLIALALIGICFAIGCSSGPEAWYAALPPEGAPIPAFTFRSLSEGRVSDQTVRGAPTVIALWASYCPASREAVQAMEQLRIAYASHGVHVLVLADDSSAAPVRRLLDSAAVHFPVALARGQLEATFSPHALLPWRRTFALPSFLVLDPAGRVVHRAVGITREPAERLESVRNKLDSLLSADDRRLGASDTASLRASASSPAP